MTRADRQKLLSTGPFRPVGKPIDYVLGRNLDGPETEWVGPQPIDRLASAAVARLQARLREATREQVGRQGPVISRGLGQTPQAVNAKLSLGEWVQPGDVRPWAVCVGLDVRKVVHGPGSEDLTGGWADLRDSFGPRPTDSAALQVEWTEVAWGVAAAIRNLRAGFVTDGVLAHAVAGAFADAKVPVSRLAAGPPGADGLLHASHGSRRDVVRTLSTLPWSHRPDQWTAALRHVYSALLALADSPVDSVFAVLAVGPTFADQVMCSPPLGSAEPGDCVAFDSDEMERLDVAVSSPGPMWTVEGTARGDDAGVIVLRAAQ